MAAGNRFFAATILGGRLHPSGIPEWGPWDSSRLEYFAESYIDPGLVGGWGSEDSDHGAGRGYSISLAILFFIRLTAVVKSRRAPSSV